MPIEWWYCCLAEAEGAMLFNFAVAWSASAFVGVPTVAWDALWLVQPGYSARRQSVFLPIYQLRIGTIEIDGVPTEVVQPTDFWLLQWGAWALWLLSPASACDAGCEQSQRPTP